VVLPRLYIVGLTVVQGSTILGVFTLTTPTPYGWSFSTSRTPAFTSIILVRANISYLSVYVLACDFKSHSLT